MHSYLYRLRTPVLRCALWLLTGVVLLSACTDRSPQGMYQEAERLAAKGDRMGATLMLKSALQTTPDYAEARYLLGTLYNQALDGVAAEAELRRAIDLKYILGGRVQAELVRSLILTYRFADAVKEARVTPVFEPEPAAAIHAMRARALLEMGRIEEADAARAEAEKAYQGGLHALLFDALRKVHQGDRAASQELIEKLIIQFPADREAWILKADVLRVLGKDSEALATYNKLIELEPNFFSTRVARAGLLISLKKFKEAKADIDAARQISPRHPLGHYANALYFFYSGKPRDAQVAIQESLKLNPENASAMVLAGAIHLTLGAHVQAEQVLRQVVQVDPRNVFARRLLAKTLIELDRGKSALEVLEPMLAKDVQDIATQALAGDAYLRSGDPTNAVASYQKLLGKNTQTAEVQSRIASAYVDAGNLEKAVAAMDAANEAGGGTLRSAAMRSFVHVRKKEFKLALEVLRAYEKKDPKNVTVQSLIAAVYVAGGDHASARKALEHALELKPTYMSAAESLARLDLLDKKPDAARGRFEAILQKDKNNADAMVALASLASLKGSTKERIEWLERARKADARALEPRALLIAHYLIVQDKQKVRDIAQEANTANPAHPAALDMLATSHAMSGDVNSAASTYSRLIADNPRAPGPYQRLAAIQVTQERYADAITNYRKAVQLRPNFFDAEVGLVVTLVKAKREAEALKFVKEQQTMNPRSSLHKEAEGELYLQAGKFPLAAKAYEDAYSMEKTGRVATRIYMAQVRAGNRDAGFGRLKQWVKDNPSDSVARHYLADGLLQIKDGKGAAENYEVLAQSSPGEYLVRNNLAQAYRLLNDPRAKQIAEQLYKERSDQAEFTSTLAMVLADQGNGSRAVELARNALSQTGNDLSTRFRLAYVLAKTGDKPQARKTLEELLAKGAHFPERPDAQALLKQLAG